jgi:exonuclease III
MGRRNPQSLCGIMPPPQRWTWTEMPLWRHLPRTLARGPRYSRRFNTLYAPTAKKKLEEYAILSWNTRALLHSDADKRKAKMRHLVSLTHGAAVICLQEVHGTGDEIMLALTRFVRGWHVFAAPGPSGGAAGCAILVSKTIAPERDSIMHSPEPNGRAQRIEIVRDNSSSVVWNVHNYGFAAEEVQKIVGKMQGDRTVARASPLRRSLWVAGDWNLVLLVRQLKSTRRRWRMLGELVLRAHCLHTMLRTPGCGTRSWNRCWTSPTRCLRTLSRRR